MSKEFLKEVDEKILELWDVDDKKTYTALREHGMAEVGVREVMASFDVDELRIIVRFVKFYNHYF